MVTQKELIQDIHTKVIRMEEHMKNQNDKVFDNKSRINKIQSKLPGINIWNKLLTGAVTILSGVCGFLLKSILT